MSNGVIRRSVSLIAGKAVRTNLPASFRRHSLLDSESIPSQLSVYGESIPCLRHPKTHIRAYGTSTYGAIHGLKIRVLAVRDIRNANRIDVFFSYTNTWRRTHQEALKFAAQA